MTPEKTPFDCEDLQTYVLNLMGWEEHPYSIETENLKDAIEFTNQRLKQKVAEVLHSMRVIKVDRVTMGIMGEDEKWFLSDCVDKKELKARLGI